MKLFHIFVVCGYHGASEYQEKLVLIDQLFQAVCAEVFALGKDHQVFIIGDFNTGTNPNFVSV